MGRWRGDRWDDGFARKQRVSEVLALDIRAWKRRGWLTPPGRRFVHSWPSGAALNVVLQRNGVALFWRGRDGQHQQNVRMDWRRKTYGWSAAFLCPGCHRRCLLLYPRGSDTWACRVCCQLLYYCQLGRKEAAMARKAKEPPEVNQLKHDHAVQQLQALQLKAAAERLKPAEVEFKDVFDPRRNG